MPFNFFSKSLNKKFKNPEELTPAPFLDPQKGMDQLILIPRIEISVYERSGESSNLFLASITDGIRYVRSYYLPCLETTFGEYLNIKDNYLLSLEEDLSLSLLDFEIFVKSFYDTLDYFNDTNNPIGMLDAAVENPELTESTVVSISNLQNLKNNIVKQLNYYIDQYNKGKLFGRLSYDSISSYDRSKIPVLSKFLYLKTKQEFLQPIVDKAYPFPIFRRSFIKQSTGETLVLPSCESSKGTCCLYDKELDIINDDEISFIKIIKKCLTNVDFSECMNLTKSCDSNSDPQESYDGADFYNGDQKNNECDICEKDLTYIVFCREGLPALVSSNQIIIEELLTDNDNSNFRFFKKQSSAIKEYTNRRSLNTCCYQEPTEPTFPTEPTEPTTPTPSP